MAIKSGKTIQGGYSCVECGIERTTPEKERAAVKEKGKGQLAEGNAEQKIIQPSKCNEMKKQNRIKQRTKETNQEQKKCRYQNEKGLFGREIKERARAKERGRGMRGRVWWSCFRLSASQSVRPQRYPSHSTDVLSFLGFVYFYASG